MNALSVVIPSRNAVNLAACVNAVWQHDPGVRIIVVDDGVDWNRCIDLAPTFNCGAIITQSVKGEKPFIFARNANIGIRAAGTDDVILLNDDALLQTYCGFTAMQFAASNAPEYGILASTSNNVGNAAQMPVCAALPTRGGIRDEGRTLCFIAVLITQKCRDIVGLLDERFVGYGLDDDDYSLRVRNAGLKLGIFDGCYVDHGSLTSSFRGPAGAGGDFTPNMKLFIEKWGTDNYGNKRERSPWARLFPERCYGSFHGHRCLKKENHDGACDFYQGPVPEAA